MTFNVEWYNISDTIGNIIAPVIGQITFFTKTNGEKYGSISFKRNSLATRQIKEKIIIAQ